MSEFDILEKIFSESIDKFKKNRNVKIDTKIMKYIDVLLDNIDKNKSLVSALTTSILKKIIDPKQDIRLHRTDFSNGYSARTLDTQITSPFFKKYFPKYANKESSFLTLATRERIKWTLNDGKNLKIRNKEVKNAFLKILDQVQKQRVKPNSCLLYLFINLNKLTEKQKAIFKDTLNKSKLEK